MSDEAAAGGERGSSEEAATDREPDAQPLAPAQIELEELERRPAYMPRFPWRWIAIFGALATLIVGGYQLRQRMRADALRAQILESHDRNLRPLAERYVAFRERLERWVIGAAQAGEPETWVDPRLRISGLHSGEGLYLRLLASEAGDAAAIASGARLMGADALTRCLGIAPASARGLFEQGGFLTRDWLDEVRTTSDFMRLRVLDEQLARSSEVDVPVIASLLRAEYFLLVLQQGESRRDSPVDVYLWDLRQERQLLRTRIRANGILLPVRLRFEGAPAASAGAPPPPLFSAGAHDCSIAAQIKAMTGEPAMEVGSGAELEAQAATLEAGTAPPPGSSVADPAPAPAP